MIKPHGKRFRALETSFDADRLYDPTEAATIVKRNANTKFNETIEIHVRLGVDPKKSDQNVRGTVNLPHGTGRTVRVIAFAKGDRAREAEAAGADIVGEADLIERVRGGFTEFDVAVATPPSRRTSVTRFATSRPARSNTVSTKPASCTRSSGRRRSAKASSPRISRRCSMRSRARSRRLQRAPISAR